MFLKKGSFLRTLKSIRVFLCETGFSGRGLRTEWKSKTVGSMALGAVSDFLLVISRWRSRGVLGGSDSRDAKMPGCFISPV